MRTKVVSVSVFLFLIACKCGGWNPGEPSLDGAGADANADAQVDAQMDAMVDAEAGPSQDGGGDPVCGNGVLEAGEQCDGSAFGGQSCLTATGDQAGQLRCTEACLLDPSDCHTCGDGVIDGPEQCDTFELGGRTCQSLGYAVGTLFCGSECRVDTSGCVPIGVCGNGIHELGEGCDGSDLGGQTCLTAAGRHSGQLQCTPTCFLDVSLCHTCGDGVIEGAEACDSQSLAGATCPNLGFATGQLVCDSQCRLDVSGCIPHGLCGNSIMELGEECDGQDFGLQTCTTITGLASGLLQCDSQCILDVSSCYTCGDGIAQGPEICDGSDLRGETCQDLGFDAGTLMCSAACGYNLGGCIGCGNDLIDPGEDCDGGDLGGHSCQELGYSGGTLGCTTSCSLNPTGCYTCGNAVCEGYKGENHASCPEDCHGWIAVSAGARHTCGLQDGNVAWCWGYNVNGQLGDGTCTNRSVPTAVSGLTGVTSIEAGLFSTCALIEDGTVWCWGTNEYGQLGDGSAFPNRVTPSQVVGLGGVVAISAGGRSDSRGHACALTDAGEVWCWGYNACGGLGDGTTTDSNLPVQVIGISSAVAISVGSGYTCSLLDDGTIWCWGENVGGQLGDGTTTNRLTPVRAGSLTAAVAVSAADGTFINGAHTCATLGSGTAWCWGRNDHGQLGDQTTTTRLTPTLVVGLTGVRDVQAGSLHSCALQLNGTALCWGANTYGSIGDGSATERHQPTEVQSLAGVAQISAGKVENRSHTCAVLGDGSAWCWGYNEWNQLGDGTDITRYVPTQVATP